MQLAEAFQHTGWVGKGVLAILLLFSFFSWATMIVVALRFQRSESASGSFLTAFRKSRRLSEVQNAASSTSPSPLVGLFRAGYAEIDAQMTALAASGADKGSRIKSLDAVERSLQRAIGIESRRLSRSLPFLATTASATPFIGLFGTVWGIMVAFGNIGVTGTASIVAVAPGISEALINTAAGLFAAIPALVAYNYFLQRLRRSRQEMEDFMLEFLNLTERNFT